MHMGWCRTHAACGAVRSIHRVSIYVSLAQHHDSCRYRSEINNLHFIHTRTMFVLLTPSFCSTVASSHRSVEHLRTMVQCRSEELCESHMLIFWLRSVSFYIYHSLCHCHARKLVRRRHERNKAANKMPTPTWNIV